MTHLPFSIRTPLSARFSAIAGYFSLEAPPLKPEDVHLIFGMHCNMDEKNHVYNIIKWFKLKHTIDNNK